MAWTTTELLADVRRSGMFPSASTVTGLTDTDLLAHADKELQSRLLSLVMAAREEFYVRVTDAALVASQSAYKVPYRSIANKLRDVSLLVGTSERNLRRIEPERMGEDASNATGALPWAFYMERDSVVIVPAPSSSGGASLRLRYFARPNRLVAVSATATPTILTVTADSPTTGTTRITHSATGTTLSTSTLWDIVRARPGFEHVGLDLTATGTAAGRIDVLSSSLPSDFTTANNAGDYISAAETSPVVQLPPELHNLLYQRTLCRVLASLGDLDVLAVAEKQAVDMEAAAGMLVSNRTEGNARKVVSGLMWRNRRGSGWLR